MGDAQQPPVGPGAGLLPGLRQHGGHTLEPHRQGLGALALGASAYGRSLHSHWSVSRWWCCWQTRFMPELFNCYLLFCSSKKGLTLQICLLCFVVKK